jgi:hypothetical protein
VVITLLHDDELAANFIMHPTPELWERGHQIEIEVHRCYFTSSETLWASIREWNPSNGIFSSVEPKAKDAVECTW